MGRDRCCRAGKWPYTVMFLNGGCTAYQEALGSLWGELRRIQLRGIGAYGSWHLGGISPFYYLILRGAVAGLFWDQGGVGRITIRGRLFQKGWQPQCRTDSDLGFPMYVKQTLCGATAPPQRGSFLSFVYCDQEWQGHNFFYYLVS